MHSRIQAFKHCWIHFILYLYKPARRHSDQEDYMKRSVKVVSAIVASLLLIYFLLMIPAPSPTEPQLAAGNHPFAWNRDDLWNGLENNFREAKQANPSMREARLLNLIGIADSVLATIDRTHFPAQDSVFSTFLFNFFAMAPLVAASPLYVEWFNDYYIHARSSIKEQSHNWDIDSRDVRNTIYKLLYGTRAAVEEVLLQLPGMTFNPVMLVTEEPSATPAATIFGIPVHSGDLLVSRGGAVVSALISRGNDYPGNFSHVALIYVDDKTGIPYLVESHIEKGVAVSTAAQYVADKKLRFMVMRPRASLPQLIADSMIPQMAASWMYHEALVRHIPYDFKMESHNSSAMYCSEVGSTAYHRFGIDLWQAISTISSPGTVRLLHEFGVENFITMMPSDLEYDPQLAVVAEWRDPETLFKDHVYNAVMDVMLESADPAKEIKINPWMLPVARVVKGYSLILNLLNLEGPIPEGMSATQGLKNNTFEKHHEQIRTLSEEKARQFLKANGYIPPYWQMITMAEESLQEVGARL